MKNNQLEIALEADDITAEDFKTFLHERFPNSETSILSAKLNKEGRGLNEIISFVFSHDIAVNLLASLIFEFCKFGFQKLGKAYGSQPKVVIILKDSTKIELPSSMSEAEIQQRILDAATTLSIKSMHFDS